MDDLDVGTSSADKQCGSARSASSHQPPASSNVQHPRQWPRLPQLQLSTSDLSRRRGCIGGSDANLILSGDSDRVRQLWLEKRGKAEREDLSTNVAVMLGCWTEPFNRQWYEQLTGHELTRIGEHVSCRRYPWRSATLDGVIDATHTLFEAKHTNAFATSDEVLERYMPQLQHNMSVTGYEQAVLSVIFGNHKYEVFEIAADWLYQSELLDAEQRFWTCVVDGTEPVVVEPPPAPRAIGTREVCLDGSNAWASAAFDWRKYREAAKAHATACTAIKALIADDVARAFGHGIEAKRNKSGAITIRELA